jgi:hypothetical protein
LFHGLPDGEASGRRGEEEEEERREDLKRMYGCKRGRLNSSGENETGSRENE